MVLPENMEGLHGGAGVGGAAPAGEPPALCALVTGATGGIGRAFAEQLLRDGDVDELWAVARTREKLERLRDELGCRTVPLAADLATAEGLRAVERALEEA